MKNKKYMIKKNILNNNKKKNILNNNKKKRKNK